MRNALRWMSVCLLLEWGGPPNRLVAGEQVVDKVDWASFLARHDLVWNRRPMAWDESSFLGNGLLGLTIHGDKHAILRWNIGRSDVTDHRTENTGHTAVSYDRARLPIGHFALTPVGLPGAFAMRQDLWNAETTGSLDTDKGRIEWRAFVDAEDPVMAIEFKTSGEERGFKWEWIGEESASPRRATKKLPPGGYKPNPPCTMSTSGEIHTCRQTLLVGGGYATAWQEIRPAEDTRVVFVSVGNSWRIVNGAFQNGALPQTMDAEAEAVGEVTKAAHTGIAALAGGHRAWWHAFYPRSFLSIPDTRMEGFYWIQMYKLGSATRADRPAIDLMGPWFVDTIWPAFWANLNTQLTYYPVYTANRLDLGESLCRMLDANMAGLIQNVNPPYRSDSAAIGRVAGYDCVGDMLPEMGNLTWLCHNYWRQCRYGMDDGRLREKLFPLLRRSINYYLHKTEKGADGKFHLPMSTSPEYPRRAPDCNYDMALLTWGCGTLIGICEKFGLADPLLPKWREILAGLPGYAIDQHGMMIGKGVPFAESHRHYSHLLMIYPLYLVNWDQPGNRDLISRSFDHWMGLAGGHAAYSYTGASSICASIGRRDDAVAFMNRIFDGPVWKNAYIASNTMYVEGGNPVMETPLSGAQSIQDLLLQSWNGTMRIFPGVPAIWKDAVFHDLRAEGAFLVSAARRDGRTRWERVRSLAGEPCRIKTSIEGGVRMLGGRPDGGSLRATGDGVYEIDMKKGEEVILFPGGAESVCVVEPVAAEREKCNYFGGAAGAGKKSAK